MSDFLDRFSEITRLGNAIVRLSVVLLSLCIIDRLLSILAKLFALKDKQK